MVAPERSTSCQKLETEKRGSIAARAPTRILAMIDTHRAFI